MNILEIKINWRLGYADNPRLQLLVEDVPDYRELKYFTVSPAPGHDLYWSELDNYVDFYHYRGPGDGFGGHEFNLPMVDGGHALLTGPWSGSASQMNEYFPHCAAVDFTDSLRAFIRGWTFSQCHMLVDFVDEALKRLRPELTLKPFSAHGGMFSDGQMLAIMEGIKDPVMVGYRVMTQDGRAKVSVSQALAWDDEPGMSDPFRTLYDYLGLETEQDQSRFYVFLDAYFGQNEDRDPQELWLEAFEAYKERI